MMNLHTKKDVLLWLTAGNHLSNRVEMVCRSFEKNCHRSKDARVKALGKAIYRLEQEFDKGLRDAMDYISTHPDEFGDP